MLLSLILTFIKKVRFHNPVFYYFIVQKLLLITRLYATYVIADEEHEEIIKSVLL